MSSFFAGIEQQFPSKKVLLFPVNGEIRFGERSYWKRLRGRYINSHENDVQNRDILASLYQHQVSCLTKEGLTSDLASKRVCFAWDKAYAKETSSHLAKRNPSVVQDHAFLKFYLQGRSISEPFYSSIEAEIKKLSQSKEEGGINLEVVYSGTRYHGLAAKITPHTSISTKARIKKDHKEDSGLIAKTQKDLLEACKITDASIRRKIVMSMLSGAAYRDLHGVKLKVPNLEDDGEVSAISYLCEDMQIGRGLHAYLLRSEGMKARNIISFQGTASYPSQQGWIHEIHADFHEDGVGAGAFEEDKDKISEALSSLKAKDKLPLITGHSLGGSLARHTLYRFPNQVEAAYLYNPPGMEEKTAKEENELSEDQVAKEFTFCRLGDPIAWEIGTKISRQTRLVIGSEFSGDMPSNNWDYLLLPYLFRKVGNIARQIGNHNRLPLLQSSYVVVPLEASKENDQRIRRPYYRAYQKVRPVLHKTSKKVSNLLAPFLTE